MYTLRTIWKRLMDIVKEAWIIMILALAMLLMSLWMDGHTVNKFGAICVVIGLLGLFLFLLLLPTMWERLRPQSVIDSD